MLLYMMTHRVGTSPKSIYTGFSSEADRRGYNAVYIDRNLPLTLDFSSLKPLVKNAPTITLIHLLQKLLKALTEPKKNLGKGRRVQKRVKKEK